MTISINISDNDVHMCPNLTDESKINLNGNFKKFHQSKTYVRFDNYQKQNITEEENKNCEQPISEAKQNNTALSSCEDLITIDLSTGSDKCSLLQNNDKTKRNKRKLKTSE